METLKNFLMGLFVALLAIACFIIGLILWPFLLSIGSLVLFVAAAVLGVVLIFYLIVLIGYIVRKGTKKLNS